MRSEKSSVLGKSAWASDVFSWLQPTLSWTAQTPRTSSAGDAASPPCSQKNRHPSSAKCSTRRAMKRIPSSTACHASTPKMVRARGSRTPSEMLAPHWPSGCCVGTPTLSTSVCSDPSGATANHILSAAAGSTDITIEHLGLHSPCLQTRQKLATTRLYQQLAKILFSI